MRTYYSLYDRLLNRRALARAFEKVRRAKGAPGIDGREVVAERTPLLGAGIKVRALSPTPDESTATEPAIVELTPERRDKLKAFVTANNRLTDEVKTRMLAQLDADRVPTTMVERLESRMGG